MEQEKTTIQAAAKALGVTTKTIQRYLANGALSKIKEGSRTYVLIDEIRTLRQGQEPGTKKDVQTNYRDRDRNTITIELKEYKELLKELGHYKGQVEGQTRHLIEYKADIERKDKELAEAKSTLAMANQELQKAIEYKKDSERKAKSLIDQQAELDRLRSEVERLRVPWWRKIFRKA